MGIFRKIISFYVDGFRNMTWGKELWFLIFLKVFILFVILKIFFFKPAMAGKTDQQKSEFVGKVLTGKVAPNSARDEMNNNDNPKDIIINLK